MKGGGVKSMVDLRNPAFLGAIMDVLPRCIDRSGPNGEKTRGIYNSTLANAIGDRAYDQGGHRNTGFLKANAVGPYPKAMQIARQYIRLDSVHNWGLTLESPTKDRERLGPLATETPADERNRGAMERKRKERTATEATIEIHEESEGRLNTQDLTKALAEVINEMQDEEETEAAVATTTGTAEETRAEAAQHVNGLQRGSLRGRTIKDATAGANEANKATPLMSETERRARSAKAPMRPSQQLREESRGPRDTWGGAGRDRRLGRVHEWRRIKNQAAARHRGRRLHGSCGPTRSKGKLRI